MSTSKVSWEPAPVPTVQYDMVNEAMFRRAVEAALQAITLQLNGTEVPAAVGEWVLVGSDTNSAAAVELSVDVSGYDEYRLEILLADSATLNALLRFNGTAGTSYSYTTRTSNSSSASVPVATGTGSGIAFGALGGGFHGTMEFRVAQGDVVTHGMVLCGDGTDAVDVEVVGILPATASLTSVSIRESTGTNRIAANSKILVYGRNRAVA